MKAKSVYSKTQLYKKCFLFQSLAPIIKNEDKLFRQVSLNF